MINVRFEIWHSILGTFLENKVALQKKSLIKLGLLLAKKSERLKMTLKIRILRSMKPYL